jgi:hypothetical protein
MALAMHSAKKSVLTQLRAQGLRVAHFSAKEIAVLAEAELARNREQLIANAERSLTRRVDELSVLSSWLDYPLASYRWNPGSVRN